MILAKFRTQPDFQNSKTRKNFREKNIENYQRVKKNAEQERDNRSAEEFGALIEQADLPVQIGIGAAFCFRSHLTDAVRQVRHAVRLRQNNQSHAGNQHDWRD